MFIIVLCISKLVNKDCYISVYFIDEIKIEMLYEFCYNVECSSVKLVEILVCLM